MITPLVGTVRSGQVVGGGSVGPWLVMIEAMKISGGKCKLTLTGWS